MIKTTPKIRSLSYSYENGANAESDLAFSDAKYQDWLGQRHFFATDTAFLALPANNSPVAPSFHFFARVPKGFESRLADTLDSLGQQIYERWRLDIISTLPSPDGLSDVPNLGWHTVGRIEDCKEAMDSIAKVSTCDFIIEIASGAKLDILYLWRLASESITGAEKQAYFVDDDCFDEQGSRHSPRFKPGTNPSHLLASDLAGPLCVRTAAWNATGGASESIDSPWFDHLLRLVGMYGWSALGHIADVLVSYANQAPGSPSACQTLLKKHLAASDPEVETRNVSARSWDIRFGLRTSPGVTIAVLSQGQLEFITRCVESILANTRYPEFEILVVCNQQPDDPPLESWRELAGKRSTAPKIRFSYVEQRANHATRCNVAVSSANHELVVLAREETVFVQELWLDELVRCFAQTSVAAVSPLVHQAGDAKILASGTVLGLLGESSSPYSGVAPLGHPGYLDSLQVTRDVTALSPSCFIVRKDAFGKVGSMDAEILGDHYADIDLCLKFRQGGQRLLTHPRASVIYGGDTSQYDLKTRLEDKIARMEALKAFRQRWGDDAVVDPYWNPNLSLSNNVPQPEVEFRAQWQYLPSTKPRILAHPLGNGQGDFRVVSPLAAARRAGLATECVWRQHIVGMARYFTAAEISRLAPSSVIIQNYIHDISLAVLDEWHSSSSRPFIVYALDDLINDLDKTNPFRKHIPPNARSRLKYALSKCDRMVVSTDFLAETYKHFIADIRVVPNRLEKAIWHPLTSAKRTGKKVRIGWAGGSTHQGDLLLLKEIIEQTRNEADWIFFGMCPDEIRPLLAEFHDLVPFDDYPSHLASLNLDLAVAPLTISPFNQGKSNLRLLEYGILGIPVICTDIDPYHNSPACRVRNDPSAWISAIRERIHDAEAREKEGAAMRDWVNRHYLLEEHLEEWLRAHLPD